MSSACGMIHDELHKPLFVSVQELQKVTTLQVRQCESMLDIKPTTRSSCSDCWKDHRSASENESKMLIRNDDVLHLIYTFHLNLWSASKWKHAFKFAPE